MRHADVSLVYQGVDISQSIAGDVLSFEYDEVSDGDADSLSLSLQNKTLKWMNGWMPNTGDRVKASLVSHDWNAPGEVQKLDCGEMVVDDPEFSGLPHTATLKALNIPADAGYNDTPADYTWNKISMKQLGESIAKKYGLAFVYDAPVDFTMTALKRSGQTDADFLNSTAKKYNLCVKIYSNRLVIYSKAVYEARKPVSTLTLGKSNISGYSFSTPTVGTGYSAVTETYTLPGSDKTLTYTFRIAPGGKVLQLNDSVDDVAQAEMAAKAAFRQANEQQCTGSITLSLDLKIVAACTIQLAGFGKLSGKYFIDSANHKAGGSTGQTEVSFHRCLQGGY